MKKFIKYMIVVLISFFCFNVNVYALEDDLIKVYFFHGDGCPHCAEEAVFLDTLESKYSNVSVVKYEVWYNTENDSLLSEVKTKMGIGRSGVPLTVIGDTYVVGYSEAASLKIERAIDYYKNNQYRDAVELIKNKNYVGIDELEDGDDDDTKSFEDIEKETDQDVTIKVPLLGSVNLKKVSISTAAILIGLVDGFNPCAMWVLLFLISVLIGTKSKKKLWLFGGVFLLTSALVYIGIMMSWLNIAVKVSTSIILRNIIAVVAIVGGIVNLKSFFEDPDDGCKVTTGSKRKEILKKIRKFTHEKSTLLGLCGIIGLAISVNVIELACSAGLPLIFTQLLAINKIVGVEAFAYTLLYILFFLIDDLIVFAIAAYTMEATGLSTKYGKYSHLIGGIIMFIIGVLLIFKPEWLMFQFV